MRYITILKPQEMADELDIPLNTLKTYFNKLHQNYDRCFPHVKVGREYRFVKELALRYWKRKKKQDCLPNLKQENILPRLPKQNCLIFCV